MTERDALAIYNDPAFRRYRAELATRAGALIYGSDGPQIRSEAILKLDLGGGRTPAMVVFGSTDESRFHPHQATDLLAFFGQAIQASLRRWLN